MASRLLFFVCFCVFSCSINYWPSAVWARVYEAGPGKEYDELHKVPFDALRAGDHLKIYYRQRPYKTIFIIRNSGRKEKPIIIEGVPDEGRLPVIDGDGAIESQADHSKQFGRWLIKVGDKKTADYVIIRNLHLQNANNQNRYRYKGRLSEYKDNAGGVFIKQGKNVRIENCEINSCGNGIISSYLPYVNNVLIDSCVIYDNGNHKNPGSPYEHNIYMGSGTTVIQFSKIFNPRSGHCIKDRSNKTIIRYNWIEGGKNRQLDLVDHASYNNADAIVYGNVIIQGKKSKNRNMIHWGGDHKISRSGTLYFYNNTVIGRSSQTNFFITRYIDCSIWMKNNIINGIGILWNNMGGLIGSNNWFSKSIKMPDSKILGIIGFLPGFLPDSQKPYQPGPGSRLINAGNPRLPLKVKYMPKPDSGRWKRPQVGNIDIGWYQRPENQPKSAVQKPATCVA